MLHLITNTKLIKEYENKFHELLIKNHPLTRSVFLKTTERTFLNHAHYKPHNKKFSWPPENYSIWFIRIIDRAKNFNYYFGLGRDAPFRNAKKYERPVLKGKLNVIIEPDNYQKSNLLFAKEDENGEINLLLKIDLNNLEKKDKFILKEKNEIIKLNDEKHKIQNFYLNLGSINNNKCINNLRNFISNTKTKNDLETNMIKIVYLHKSKESVLKYEEHDRKEAEETMEIENLLNNKNIPKTLKHIKDDIMDKKQEIIIKELKEGKSIKEAAKNAETLEIIVNRWIKLGKEGDDRYTNFYNEYKEIIGIEEETENDEGEKDIESPETKSTAKENKELVKKTIELLKENKTIDEVKEILNIPENKVKNWHTQGKLGIKPFDEFFNLIEESGNKIKETQIDEKILLNELNLKELDFVLEDNGFFEMVPNKDVKIKTILSNINSDDIKTSLEKLNELKLKQKEIATFLEQYNTKLLLSFLNKYDSVLYKNKSRDQIIDRIIKELKFTDTDEFHNKMSQLPEEEKIDEKELEEIEKSNKTKEIKIEEEEVKKCIICGKKLKKYTTKDKCKSCSRSIHAANILNNLLNSIGPEVPFFKEDLEKLGYSTIKIQDIIWTLQENDLINKESSKKYSLKNEKILNKFLEEWKEYIEEIEDPKGTKLSKKCIMCNKELPITKFNSSDVNEDGLEDYCKDCARPIQTAKGLKTLLNYIAPEEEFRKEDLYTHYQEQFLLDAEIFSLQEYDLIELNVENNIYVLKKKEKIDKFLDKYLIDEEESNIEEPVEETTEQEEEPKEETTEQEDSDNGFVFYTNNKFINRKMNQFINELKISKDKKKSLEKSNLNELLLNSWIRFGKTGLPDYVKFYEDYTNIINAIEETSEPAKEDGAEESQDPEFIGETGEDEGVSSQEDNVKEEYEFGYSIENHAKFIEEIRNGKTDSEAFKIIGLTRYQIDKWHEKGLNGEEPYNKFHKDYLNAKIYAKNHNEYFKRENEISRANFIGHIKKGKPIRTACDFSGLDFETVQKWINLGNKGEYPYKEFYKEYMLAKKEYEIPEGIITDPEKNSSIKIIVTEEYEDNCEIMIKGKIENDKLIRSIYKLYNYQKDIQKIFTNRINNQESDLLIIVNTTKNNIETIQRMFL